MLPENDHVKSFFNSIQLAKNAFAPLESGIRKAAKDFEHFWPRSNNGANKLQLFMGEVNVVGDRNGSKDQISSVKKISGNCMADDERKKSLSIKFPIKTLLEMLSRNCESNGHQFDLPELGSKERNGSQEERNCLNCLQVHKMSNEDKICSPWCANASRPRVSLETKRKELKRHPVAVFHDVVLKDKEVNNLSLNCLIGFMIDLFPRNLQKCDIGEQRSKFNSCDLSPLPPPINHFDDLKVLTSILEGKRADICGFLGNLKFAKVGRVPSSMIGVTSPVKQDSGDGFNTTIREEIGELTELVPQLRKMAKHHPEKFGNGGFGAVTAVAAAPPAEKPAGSVLKSALAGGLSCAFSTALMHPIDTIKTHVQASTLSFPEIVSKIPQIGASGLYKGSTPAILGQFLGHGFRTGFFEASKIVLINVAPSLANRQVESVLSFCSAVLGTVARVPSEVVKQRLQAGVFDHLGEAIIGTWQQEGLKGFFRGTGATLCREVPFYVAGLGFYTESKKAVQRIIGRELEPWETIAVGAITGGLTAVSTTPFDVVKTRMMISTQGRPVSMYMVAFSILRQDGPLGLFKGAVPRFFWVAPLGAINFAGYELARKAMG